VQKAVIEACQGSFSFGAPTEREVDMALLLVSMVPGLEKIRMVNSGTEATMSAVRLARGYTGRDKIIKFEGCYHGHGDSFLIAAGSGAITHGEPNSPGVTEGTALDTLTARYNDLESVSALLEGNQDQVAALILEPVAGNMGCVLPREGFLQGLRKLCDEHGVILIFDEVMTGFRLAKGGAQELFGVTDDLCTYGKIIGGGMPVGAYGGRKDLMDYVSPQGPVYQAGTLSGNPIAMAAGITMLTTLKNDSDVYSRLNSKTLVIVSGLKQMIQELDVPVTVNHVGSMFSLFFNRKEVYDFDSAKNCDLDLFKAFFHGMLERGVYFPPSQFETCFVSDAVSNDEIDHLLQSCKEVLTELFK
jgi:glutamate-1-semialdehyde 2,1-aminomutase